MDVNRLWRTKRDGHDLIGPVTGDAPIVLRKRLSSHAAIAIAVPNTIGCVPLILLSFLSRHL
jgi:hypothetical protein